MTLSNNADETRGEARMSYTESTPREIAPGVFFSWINDRRIAAFNVTSVARNSLDIYIELNKKLLHSWPKNRTYLVLHAAVPEVDVPPYLNKRYMELMYMAQQLHLQGRDAILIPKDSTAFLMQMMIRKHRPTLACIEPRIYYDRDAAVHWLMELM